MKDYDEALRLEPQRARTYSNRSAAYRKLGRTEKAIEDVTTAIRIDPTQPQQRNFVEKHRVLAWMARLFRLDLAQLPVTMP
ncbi:tetratricopeptide repeat protein [Bradyrhizobium sp. AZCC 1693]|uniref:tetratricopeptide repeat protein n=1 Tax=Bradyrhizobium sp. AZCC 1693 TaxID=3117029 RepID=UPI003FA56B04